MAGTNYKGITIQIGGDTVDLQKAMTAATKSITDFSKEVGNLSKITPDAAGMEKFAAAVEPLKNEIAAATDKLNLLKEAQDQVVAGTLSMNDEQYKKLGADIDVAEKKLSALNDAQTKLNAVLDGSNLYAFSASAGQSQIKKDVADLDAQLRLHQSELAKVNAEYDNGDKSLIAYCARLSVMQSQYEDQAKKVEVLKQAVETSSKAYGENSAEVLKWQTALNQAQAGLTTMQNGLDGVQAEMNAVKSGAADAGSGLNDLGDKMENAGQKASVFGDVLKANLVSDAIQKGLSMALDFAKKGAELYESQAQSMTKLTTVMQNTMGLTANAAKKESQSIADLAKQYEKIGVVSKTAQIAGSQELATYISKKETLQSLIPVMNDMLAQQYGINATQEQAVNIATLLGKVMDGQTGALSRYGYAFDEVQANILKTGTESERAAALIDVVSKSVGGMNEELGKTDMGKYAQQTNEMAESQAKIGEEWQKANMALQSGLMPTVNTLIEGFTSMPEGIQQAVLACGALAAAGVAVNSAFGLTGLIIAGIGAAAMGIFAAVKNAQNATAQAAQDHIDKLNNLADAASKLTGNDRNVDILAAKYKVLRDSIDSGTLSASELKAAYDQLKEVKQQLIDLSDGMITANDLESGSIDDLAAKIKGLTENEKQSRILDIKVELEADSIDNLKKVRDGLQATQDDLIKQKGDATDLKLALHDLDEEYGNLIKTKSSMSKEDYDIASQDIIDRYNALTGANIKLAGAFPKIGEAANKAGWALDNLNGQIDANAKALQEAQDKYTAYQNLQNEYNALIGDGAEAQHAATDAQAAEAVAQELAARALKARMDAQLEFISQMNDTKAALKAASDENDKYILNINSLQSVYDSLHNKQALNQEQIFNLINSYPELSKYIAENSDLTFQNGEVIRQVMESRRQEAIQLEQDEIAKTKTAIKGAQDRITALQAEMAVRHSWDFSFGGGDLLAAQKEYDDLIQKMTDAQAKLAALNNTSYDFGGGDKNDNSKAVKETNDALTEQLAILDHKKKMGQVNTEQEIAEVERIQAEYAKSTKEKEDLDERLYDLKKTLRDKDYQDELKNIDKMKQDDDTKTNYNAIIAAYSNLQTELNKQYKQGVISYDDYSTRYDEVSQKITDSLKAQAKQADAIFQQQTNTLKQAADDANAVSDRIISLSKAMDGMKMPDGTVFHFTSSDELDVMKEQLATLRDTDAQMRALAGDESAWSDAQKKILDDSAKQIQAYNDKITDMTVKIAQDFQTANDKLVALNAQRDADMAKADKDYADNVAAVNAKLADDLKKAEQDYSDKMKSLLDKQKQSEKQVTDAYNAELDKRAKSLANFTGLFSDVVKKNVSGKDLLQYLNNQLDTMQDFYKNLAELQKRGVSGELLDYLSGLGPSAADDIAALTTLSDEELQKYIDMYNEKNELARQQAEAGMADQRQAMNDQLDQIRNDTASQMAALSDEYTAQMDQLNSDAQAKLDDLAQSWKDGLQKINDDAAAQVDQLKTTISDALSAFDISGGLNADGTAAGDAIKQIMDNMQAVADSFAKMNQTPEVVMDVTADFSGVQEANLSALDEVRKTEPDWKKEGGALVKSATSGVAQTTQTLTDQAYKTGAAAMEGLAQGISDNEYLAVEAARLAAEHVSAALTSGFGVASPSKVTERIGQFVASGLALGMIESMPIVEAAALKLSVAGTPPVPAAGAGEKAGSGAAGTQPIEVNIENNIYTQNSNDLPYQVDRANQRQLRGVASVLGRK